MKNRIKLLISICLSLGIINSLKAQEENTVAVLNIYTNLEGITPSTAGSLLRIELEKNQPIQSF